MTTYSIFHSFATLKQRENYREKRKIQKLNIFILEMSSLISMEDIKNPVFFQGKNSDVVEKKNQKFLNCFDKADEIETEERITIKSSNLDDEEHKEISLKNRL